MSQNKAVQRIALLSLCHMGIDFLCAFALYHSFVRHYEAFLLYNFCAFALQMPLGIMIDVWSKKSRKTLLPGTVFTIMGIVLTVCGSFISPIILGIGNALFHVGGGVLTIHEDDDNSFNGRGLGTFVAPGAIGLILGILYYETQYYTIIQLAVSVIMGIIGFILYMSIDERTLKESIHPYVQGDKKLTYLIVSCFAVVVIRSLTGMSILFPWKTTKAITIISVIALAAGKTIGGFIAAEIGMKKTVIITLITAALAYMFADKMWAGLLALLFFNMTMPLTLYLLVKNMSDMPGYAFGILTFGLFLGYLPVHYGFIKNLSPSPYGVIASLLSLIILYFALKAVEDKNE